MAVEKLWIQISTSKLKIMELTHDKSIYVEVTKIDNKMTYNGFFIDRIIDELAV